MLLTLVPISWEMQESVPVSMDKESKKKIKTESSILVVELKKKKKGGEKYFISVKNIYGVVLWGKKFVSVTVPGTTSHKCPK